MDDALNIDTNVLKKKISSLNIKGYFNYTFLNDLNLDDYEIYYNILYIYESFQLKNIYNYIYDRIESLRKKHDLERMIKININENINGNILNELLNDYIDKDIIKSIIIINSIQQYFYPIKKL